MMPTRLSTLSSSTTTRTPSGGSERRPAISRMRRRCTVGLNCAQSQAQSAHAARRFVVQNTHHDRAQREQGHGATGAGAAKADADGGEQVEPVWSQHRRPGVLAPRLPSTNSDSARLSHLPQQVNCS